MFLGTHADNVADRHAKGRDGRSHYRRPGTAARGSANGSAKLTEEMIPAIRARLMGETIMSVAADYGVSFTAIQAIRAGRTWRHVP